MKIQEYLDKSLILAIGFTLDFIWRDLNEQLKRERCNFLQVMARSYRIHLKQEGKKVAIRLIDIIDRLEERFISDLSKEYALKPGETIRGLGPQVSTIALNGDTA